MLATHQEMQKKARNEILSVVDPAVGLTYDVIDQFGVLAAVSSKKHCGKFHNSDATFNLGLRTRGCCLSNQILEATIVAAK
jgi:hypothetical protein